MNESVHISIKVICICFASTNLSLGRLCFLPLFTNVIKNNIISSVIHIIVCLLKTK